MTNREESATMQTSNLLPPTVLLISVREAARRVGLGNSTVYDLIQAGKFPHKRVGRRLLVPVKALEEWALTCNGIR
jgi:excisionase family DNA binding protein